MRVLVLEPFYGGSHRRFLDRWRQGSRHDLDLLTLSAHHWKWRMRHGAVDFADQARELMGQGARWDVLFCSDMLGLAEFRGLLPSLPGLPSVAYFHENQLTYPVREERERDMHFAVTNLTTALAADEIWWNSAFHRDDFLGAAERWLARMPKSRLSQAPERIRRKSQVVPQGIEMPPESALAARRAGGDPRPLSILWAGRWEFDKNPELFFQVIERLERRGVDFRLNVLGESYRQSPEIFEQVRTRLAHRIDRWGYQASRDEYWQALCASDIFVSTADHEFFGVAAAEAIAAGCFPLLPNRLAYPGLLSAMPESQRRQHLYDSTEVLEQRLVALAARVAEGQGCWAEDPDIGRKAMAPYAWSVVRHRLDNGLERVAGASALLE